MDQWHVGRACCNDGLAIFFDMDPSLAHGQVQLYAAPGFESAFLDNSERQAIFEDDMLPYLRDADFDAALLAALHKVDAAATPEHAAQLQTARQVNAVMGLIGAPAAVLGLGGWAFVRWRRFGKDPVYLDDPSILMPAPPPDLTAASGAMVVDGESSRRALTTAMLDLASRGLISFREEKGILSHKVGIDVQPAEGDAELAGPAGAQRPSTDRARRRPSRSDGSARSAGVRSNYVSPDHLPEFGAAVDDFDKALEEHVVAQGWYAEAPSKVVSRYSGRAWLAIAAGIGATFAGLNIPISGLTMIGIAIIVGRDRHAPVRPGDARGDQGRVGHPGDAGRLSADAPDDHAAGALHAAGGRRSERRRDDLARHARSGHRLGDGARAPARDRGRPRAAASRTCSDGRAAGDRPVLPELVYEFERQRRSARRTWRAAAGASSRTRASPTWAG